MHADTKGRNVQLTADQAANIALHSQTHLALLAAQQNTIEEEGLVLDVASRRQVTSICVTTQSSESRSRRSQAGGHVTGHAASAPAGFAFKTIDVSLVTSKQLQSRSPEPSGGRTRQMTSIGCRTTQQHRQSHCAQPNTTLTAAPRSSPSLFLNTPPHEQWW